MNIRVTATGLGRVLFPRDGSMAVIFRLDNESFTLADIGTYEITFRVQTTEQGTICSLN
jgi:hypothetical protein